MGSRKINLMTMKNELSGEDFGARNDHGSYGSYGGNQYMNYGSSRYGSYNNYGNYGNYGYGSYGTNSEDNGPQRSFKDYIFILRAVSYTHLTLPTNREV